jgi:hypothetical protein
MLAPVRCLALAVGLAVGLGVLRAASAAADTAWPAPEIPAGARVVTVAGDLVLNGRSCVVSRFHVAARLDEVLQFYRTQFRPTRAVETGMPERPAIATRRGDHFITVQLQATGAVVQGLVITTALSPARSRSAAARDTEALLPADTVVVSTQQSDVAGQRALLVIGVNRHGVGANRDHVVAALQARGFRRADDDVPATGPAAMVRMSSAQEDALLSVGDTGPYRTVLVQRTREAPR